MKDRERKEDEEDRGRGTDKKGRKRCVAKKENKDGREMMKGGDDSDKDGENDDGVEDEGAKC